MLVAPFALGAIAAAIRAAGGGVDSTFNNTKVLLHFNGDDGSTAFVDSSSYGNAFTAVGAVHISRTRAFFGSASGRFNGGYIQAPDSDEFNIGAGAFTLQFMLWPDPGGFGTIVAKGSAATGQAYEYSFAVGSDDVTIYWGVRGSNTRLLRLIFPSPIPVGEWSHIEICRDGAGVWRAFSRGVQNDRFQAAPLSGSPSYGSITTGNPTDTTDLGNTTAPLTIGAFWAGFGFQIFYGWIDELRFKVGEALHTTNFTPPTAPYPDSGPPVVGTTWNPSDKTAGWTLSGGNLTASETTNAYEGVRSVAGKSSGKWYWELLIDSVNDGNGVDAYPGIRRADTAIGTTPGSGTDALVRTNGSLFANGGPTAGTGGVDYPRGSIMMIALDLDAGRMWCGKNGTWNNSGNPAAGTNATFTTIPAGTWHAYCGTDNNAPKNIVTLNTGTTGFSYTPPSGFSALA